MFEFVKVKDDICKVKRYLSIAYMSDVIDKFKHDGEKGGLFVVWTKVCCIKQHVQQAAGVDGR